MDGEERRMDRITLKMALDTDPWMMVYASEPDREISVEMRYKDLVAIRKLIVRYCEEQRGKKNENI
jgi:hypothetical protein